MKKFKLGISACLAGRNVRYDGGHKYAGELLRTLSEYADFVEICPEYHSGLGVPRETMDLIGSHAQRQLIGRTSGSNYYQQLERFSATTMSLVMDEELCGFILKSKSPSCGLIDARMFKNLTDEEYTLDSGVFALQLLESHPYLPLADELMLQDEKSFKSLIVRATVMQEWWDFTAGDTEQLGLEVFHEMQRGRLKAHKPKTLADLDAYVKDSAKLKLADTMRTYLRALMDCLE